MINPKRVQRIKNLIYSFFVLPFFLLLVVVLVLFFKVIGLEKALDEAIVSQARINALQSSQSTSESEFGMDVNNYNTPPRLPSQGDSAAELDEQSTLDPFSSDDASDTSLLAEPKESGNTDSNSGDANSDNTPDTPSSGETADSSRVQGGDNVPLANSGNSPTHPLVANPRTGVGAGHDIPQPNPAQINANPLNGGEDDTGKVGIVKDHPNTGGPQL